MEDSRDARLENELASCPECGYEGGFHVVMERREDVPDTDMRVHLRCPGCSVTYDIGWVARLAGQ